MTNAQKPISRSTSLVLVVSLWVMAAAFVNAQTASQGPTRDATEVSGRELWKFETGG
jgi:hypothetical protein